MNDPGGTSPAGGVRASDAEREQAAEALREHYAAGRLSEDELSERLDGVYKATTVQELDRLRVDLPALPVSPLVARAQLARRRAELRGHLIQRAGTALSPFFICSAIWLVSGAQGMFWPAWLLILPVAYFARNAWRLYGPAPQLEAVQAELESRRRDERGRRHQDPRSHRRRRERS